MTHGYEPFLGVWTGAAPQRVGGPIRLMVRGIGPAGPPECLLDFEALGALTPLTGVTVTDGTFQAAMGPTRLRLERVGPALRGSLTSDLLPDFTFVLRRGQPAGESAATPATGMGRALLAAAEEGRLPWVDSLQLIQDGAPVLEAYFHGRTAENLHSLQSATKSITALLLGTLVAEGAVDPDAPVWRYLGHRAGSRWVAEKYDVSIHELLAMSAALDWDEVSRSYFDPANDASRMNAAPDWIAYVLDKPVRADRKPGRFEYQSGLSLLLGEVIRAVAGEPVPEAARRRLFEPMGIDDFHWMTVAGGVCHTGGGLWLRPRDFAKFGRLILSEGEWEGRRLLPAEWIRRCLTAHSTPETPFPMVPRMAAYGYQWWLLDTECADGRIVRSASALGHGGQVMHVLPEQGAVIVATAHDWLGSNEPAGLLLDIALDGAGDRDGAGDGAGSRSGRAAGTAGISTR